MFFPILTIHAKYKIYLIIVFLICVCSLNFLDCYYLNDLYTTLRHLTFYDYYNTNTAKHKELYLLICQKNKSILQNETNEWVHQFHYLINKEQINDVDYLNNRVFSYAYICNDSTKWESFSIANFQQINNNLGKYIQALKACNSNQSDLQKCLDVWAYIYLAILEEKQNSIFYFIINYFFK